MILVTGGSGFIGTNLCLYLLEQGKKVVCLDIKESLINHPNFIFFHGDVVNPIPINHKIDQIYHLACHASPKRYQANPLHTINTCIQGTINVLELAKRNSCPVLFTSTSEVYGEPTVSPQPESYRGNVNCNGIRACYDEGKRMAECIIFEYKRLYQLDIHIARLFNTYGKHMEPDDGRVITNLIMQHINGQPFTIYGDGSQTRSFCHVADTVWGLVCLMNSNVSGPINIGNPVEQTILSVAKMLDPNAEIIFKPMPLDDPTNRCPDITLAKKLLNWEPMINFKDGLELTKKFLSKYKHEQ
jgi:UDP-glucuronate decarboxylase